MQKETDEHGFPVIFNVCISLTWWLEKFHYFMRILSHFYEPCNLFPPFSCLLWSTASHFLWNLCSVFTSLLFMSTVIPVASIFLVHGNALPYSPSYEYCTLIILPFHENYTYSHFLGLWAPSGFPFLQTLCALAIFPLFASFVFCCSFSLMLCPTVLYCNACTWRWHKFCKAWSEVWY